MTTQPKITGGTRAGALRAGLLAVSLAASGSALAQTAWDMAVAWPPGNFHTRNAMAYAEAVDKATNGQVKITVKAGGQLGLKGPESMRAVRDGIVPIAEYNAPQQVGDAPIFGLEALPFLADDYAQLRILHNVIRPEYEKVFAKFGQKMLYMVPWPNQYIFTKSAVARTADVKDVKVRTTDRNTSELVKAVGMVPVQMTFADMMPALASGALGGVTTSGATAVDSRFWEHLKFAYKTNHIWSSNVLAVNAGAYAKLTPDQRAVMEKVARDMEPGFWKVSEEDDAKSAATVRERGMTVAPAAAPLHADLQKAGLAMQEDFAKRIGDPVPALLKDYRSRVKK